MEKSYYIVLFKPEYRTLLASRFQGEVTSDVSSSGESQRVILAITQGGFGQDVVDDYQQVKERFLEYLFSVEGIDLPSTSDVYSQYFQLERAEECIDLDEDL